MMPDIGGPDYSLLDDAQLSRVFVNGYLVGLAYGCFCEATDPSSCFCETSIWFARLEKD